MLAYCTNKLDNIKVKKIIKKKKERIIIIQNKTKKDWINKINFDVGTRVLNVIIYKSYLGFSLFAKWHINIRGLLNTKAILVEEY